MASPKICYLNRVSIINNHTHIWSSISPCTRVRTHFVAMLVCAAFSLYTAQCRKNREKITHSMWALRTCRCAYNLTTLITKKPLTWDYIQINVNQTNYPLRWQTNHLKKSHKVLYNQTKREGKNAKIFFRFLYECWRECVCVFVFQQWFLSHFTFECIVCKSIHLNAMNWSKKMEQRERTNEKCAQLSIAIGKCA